MSSDGAKVTGYIRQSVYNRLLDFKEANQLKSVSQAVTLILEDYLGIEPLGDAGSLCHRETQSPCGLGGIGALADGVQRPGSKQ